MNRESKVVNSEVMMVLPAIGQSMLTCSRCGNELGRVHLVEGEELIQIGALVVSEIDGNCAQCGEEFHYSLNAKRLERLLKRAER